MYYAVNSTLKVQAIKTFGCSKENCTVAVVAAAATATTAAKKTFFQFGNVD